MFWMLIALIGYLCWAFVNIGDKYVISNRVKSPYVYMMMLWLIGIFTVLLIPFIDFFAPEPKLLFWIILASFFYFYGGFVYIKAVTIEEITRINIWWNIVPILSFFGGWLLLDEKLSLNQIIAMIILLIGAILASLHWHKNFIRWSAAVPYFFVAAIAFSATALIFGYLTRFLPILLIFVWSNIFGFGFALILFFSRYFRKIFQQEVYFLDKKTVLAILSIGILDIVGMIFNIWALSLGPVALVSSLTGFQMIFVFLIAGILSFFSPSILREEWDLRSVVIKFVALIFMFAGVWLINIST